MTSRCSKGFKSAFELPLSILLLSNMHAPLPVWQHAWLNLHRLMAFVHAGTCVEGELVNHRRNLGSL